VCFTWRNGEIAGVEIEGHSGYAPAGEDIVCASVSAAVGLAERAVSDIIRADAVVDIDEKNARVSIRLNSPDDDSRIVFKALYSYLFDLSREYPQFITFTEV